LPPEDAPAQPPQSFPLEPGQAARLLPLPPGGEVLPVPPGQTLDETFAQLPAGQLQAE
jgi:hypothetical protein